MTAASGIHHITAICSTIQENYDFYTKILGLRFIKRTVNFDDPSTYHFYYGNKVGSPGSILTFFPHVGLPRGRPGLGQAVEIVFAIPKSAFSFWIDRFHQKRIKYQGPENRFNEKVLRISDPDGLMLEFIGVDDLPTDNLWTTDEINADVAIRGFYSVTLWVEGYEKTAKILTNHLGFKFLGNDGNRFRFSTSNPKELGQTVDLRCLPEIWRSLPGAGTIHHVAWRVGGDAEELLCREGLLKEGFNLTPVIDRSYFHSVYFREPNGILFELATENPGFSIDEPVESLGQTLKLPPQYEQHRKAIIAALPPLE